MPKKNQKKPKSITLIQNDSKHTFKNLTQPTIIHSQNASHEIVVIPKYKGGDCTINMGKGEDTAVFHLNNKKTALNFIAKVNGGGTNGTEDKVIIHYHNQYSEEKDKKHNTFVFHSNDQHVHVENGSVKTIILKSASGNETTYMWDKHTKSYAIIANEYFTNEDDTLNMHADGSTETLNMLDGNDRLFIWSTQEGGNYTINGGKGNDTITINASSSNKTFTAHIDGGGDKQDKAVIMCHADYYTTSDNHNFIIKSANNTFYVKKGSVQEIHLSIHDGVKTTFSWNSKTKAYELLNNTSYHKGQLLTK